jgi:cleavage stimulation factor subunit 3
MDLMRKIFHKAVHTPILNIEEIWKEYDAFENNLSKLTAKKFIADQAGGYMTARGSSIDFLPFLNFNILV